VANDLFSLIGGVGVLISLGLIWYVLGQRASNIALVMGAILFALRQIRKNAELEQEARQNEEFRKRLARANRIRTGSNADHERLREDDGFRRK